MRTTIVIESSLESRLKALASRKGLSSFINQCLREHFQKEEKSRRLIELEKSYHRAAKQARVSDEFDPTDVEDWPEW